jgi:hypothetical protein
VAKESTRQTHGYQQAEPREIPNLGILNLVLMMASHYSGPLHIQGV